jgi:hypothetical protein
MWHLTSCHTGLIYEILLLRLFFNNLFFSLKNFLDRFKLFFFCFSTPMQTYLKEFSKTWLETDSKFEITSSILLLVFSYFFFLFFKLRTHFGLIDTKIIIYGLSFLAFLVFKSFKLKGDELLSTLMNSSAEFAAFKSFKFLLVSVFSFGFLFFIQSFMMLEFSYEFQNRKFTKFVGLMSPFFLFFLTGIFCLVKIYYSQLDKAEVAFFYKSFIWIECISFALMIIVYFLNRNCVTINLLTDQTTSDLIEEFENCFYNSKSPASSQVNQFCHYVFEYILVPCYEFSNNFKSRERCKNELFQM